MLVVSIAEAVSLGIVEPPRQADIIAMEAQSFGVPLGFGGPYCGVIATRRQFVRQMPGRLVGQTTDRNGKRGFVLTLATREQHIRREKATSNICTNQALVALMVNIFMTIYGKVGLRELAKQNLAKTAYAAASIRQTCQSAVRRRAALQRIRGSDQRRSLRHQQPPPGTQDRRRLPLKKFYPELGNAALWCCTELTTRSAIDTAVGLVAESERSVRVRKGRSGRAGGGAMKHMTRKATRHVNQNEGLIFEKSSPGKAAWKLPPLDVPEVDTAALLGSAERKDLGNMPEVSEIEIIRHFTRLSTWNYAIDLGMYPLGSCTMKYNPRVNELVVAPRRPGQRASLSAGEDFAGRAAHHQDAERLPASKSPAWTRSRCNPPPARTAS